MKERKKESLFLVGSCYIYCLLYLYLKGYTVHLQKTWKLWFMPLLQHSWSNVMLYSGLPTAVSSDVLRLCKIQQLDFKRDQNEGSYFSFLKKRKKKNSRKIPELILKSLFMYIIKLFLALLHPVRMRRSSNSPTSSRQKLMESSFMWAKTNSPFHAVFSHI